MKKLLLTLSLITIISIPSIAKDRGKVVATVNGTNLYEDSVNFIYKEIPAENIEKLGGKDQVRKAIIDQLAAAEALRQAALKSDVSKSETFQKILQNEKERLIQEEYLRVNVEKNITDEQIKTTYDEALKDFKPEMEYNVYNILSKTEEDAKNIIKELDNGKDFSKLAIEKSISSNIKETKGNLGFLKESDLLEDIAKAITALEKGKYSKTPVKSPFGWNVFLLKEKRKEKAPSFEDSKEIIKQSLYKKEMMRIVEDLKTKAKIEYK